MSQTIINSNEIYSNKTVATIRQHIKRVVPTLSVKKGTGTAGAWIDVSGSQEYGTFTVNEQIALYELGLHSSPTYLGNQVGISPEERPQLLKLWGYLK